VTKAPEIAAYVQIRPQEGRRSEPWQRWFDGRRWVVEAPATGWARAILQTLNQSGPKGCGSGAPGAAHRPEGGL
jgi:hypothetical protein